MLMLMVMMMLIVLLMKLKRKKLVVGQSIWIQSAFPNKRVLEHLHACDGACYRAAHTTAVIAS